MFCPKCRYEYEPHIWKCPDCGERLVTTLPEETPPEKKYDAEDWVEMGRLTSQMSAQIVVDVLRAKDIPVVVLSASGHFGVTGQMGPSSFVPINGVYSVMVPREFVADADAEVEGVLGEEWTKSRLSDQ